MKRIPDSWPIGLKTRLEAARADLFGRRLATGLRAAAWWAPFGLAAGALLYLLVYGPALFKVQRVVAAGATGWLELGLALAFGLGGALLAASVGFLSKIGPRPELSRIASHLDESSDLEGRVTAACEFLQRGPRNGFEEAAVDDALTSLRTRHAHAPAPMGAARPFTRVQGLLVAIALFVLVGLPLIFWPSGQGGDGPRSRQQAVEDAVAEAAPRLPGTQRPERKRPDPTETPTVDAEAPVAAMPTAPRERRPTPSGARRPDPSQLPDQSRPARGKAGKGREVRAKAGRPSSAAEGDPTEATKSEDQAPEDSKKRREKQGKADRTKTIPRKREEKSESGATVGQGASGGGSMSPIESPWSQRDRGRDAPQSELANEEEIEDELEGEEARGGTQPSLKDRRGATSRDLAISGKGQGGDGRGGPSPPKKSRGVASLILGVPVPDFVRGRLNPGTTKVTHERVDPVPLTEPARPVVSGPGRDRPEAEVRRIVVPAAWRGWLGGVFEREGRP